jgi:hypothetical protein
LFGKSSGGIDDGLCSKHALRVDFDAADVCPTTTIGRSARSASGSTRSATGAARASTRTASRAIRGYLGICRRAQQAGQRERGN